MNVYLPLQEFPQEGDVFTITGKNESLGGITAVSACLLSKWGVKPHFTGVLGSDGFGEKIRNTFSEYKVNTKFIETNFEKGTATNYFILNVQSGDVTKILFNDPAVELQKFKYDFQPDWAIMDSSDTAGAMALLNNDTKVKTLFYARIADPNTVTLAKRCKTVICTQAFIERLLKVKITNDTSTEDLVSIYQKLVDEVGSNNYIVILDSRKILYSEENKVKMLPEMKINHADISSFDSVFTGAFAFAKMHDVSLDDSIKLANTAAAISISKIGEEPAIPTLEEVLTNSGLKDKLKSYQPQTEEAPQEEQTEAPQEQAEVPQEPVQEAVPSAFDQKPEDVPETQAEVQTEAAPVQEAAPVEEAPQEEKEEAKVEETPQEPPHEDTNIFG